MEVEDQLQPGDGEDVRHLGAEHQLHVRSRLPPGWTSKPLEGAVMLEKSQNDFYSKFAYRVIFLPSATERVLAT